MRTLNITVIIGILLSSYGTAICGHPEEDDAFINQILTTDELQELPPFDDCIGLRQPWRPVQERVTDTVVQVFVHVVEYDLFQPFKTPNQYATRGSGFIISEEGYIITNAHVVDQARLVWVQIPSLGKHMIDVEIIGVSPDWDLALLKISPEGLAFIKNELGTIPYLELADSDLVHRMDEVLTLGYPLGLESLKSTAGHISGRKDNLLEISAPINPGSSGGPCLNINGQVIGISSQGFTEAQNMGYIIPSNDLKIILRDLCKNKLVKKAFLGIIATFANEWQTKFLGNPPPGGCYATEILKNSPLDKAGIQRGDMIYEVDGYNIDIYGQMSVPWSEDKIDFDDYVARLSIGDEVDIVYYRRGERHEAVVTFDHVAQLAVHNIYPGYEHPEYEIFGGIVVMNLTLNHITVLADHAPGLSKYSEMKYRTEPVLFISHVFPASQCARTRIIRPGFIIRKVNDIPVHTLDDFRNAVKMSIENDYLAFTVSDTINNISDNILVVIPFRKSLEEEARSAADYRYPISDFIKGLMDTV
jgi:serine protease Do